MTLLTLLQSPGSAGSTGGVSKTLESVTLQATGTVAAGASGSVVVSLSLASLSASGSLAGGAVTGSLSKTLGGVLLSSAAVVPEPPAPPAAVSSGSTGGGGAASFYRGKYRGELRRTIESAVRSASGETRAQRRKRTQRLKARALEFVEVFDIEVPQARVFVEAPELGGLEVIRRQILDLSRNLAGVRKQARQLEEDRSRNEAETARMLQAALLSYLEEMRRIEQREEEDVISLIVALDARERM